jgi:Zn-dependent protease with chaperone function
MKSFLFVICLYSLHWGAILEPQGKIPHRFLESPQESFERKLSQSQSLSQSDLDKYKTEFFELSEFESKYFILSGKVIFGDEATLLMQKIVDQLIQNAQLGIKVEVYTIKSPVVNAFATEDNVIMVNLGLLTKVENEATLAFILSYELAHIVKDHVIENYIEQHKIKN